MNTAVLKPLPRPSRLIRICAWCPPGPKAAKEAAALALGHRVTHGICPRCLEAMRREAAAAN